MHLKVFLMVTDQGGDQQGREKIMSSEVAKMPHVLLFHSWCFKHQNALCTGKKLKRCQKGLMWWTMAKTVNTVRSVGGPKKFVAAATYVLVDAQDHGCHDFDHAPTVFRRVPPRPLKGRWQAAWATAHYLIAMGWEFVIKTFKLAFIDGRAVEAKRRGGADADADDFVLDPNDEKYGPRVGRYATEAFEELRKHAVWIMMIIFWTTAQPAEHFDNWLKKGRKENRQTMFEFVTGKAEVFYDEWMDLVTRPVDEAWPKLCAIVLGDYWGDIISDDEASDWCAEAVSHTIERATNYRFRLLEKARTFPGRVLWLIFTPPDTVCEERKECASDILTLPVEVLTDAIAKLRCVFKDDLEDAAAIGTLSDRMHNVVLDISIFWLVDTEEIEGANNCVKAVNRAAPATKHRLQSARHEIKKNVNNLSLADRAALIADCQNYHAEVIMFQKTEEYASLHNVLKPTDHRVAVECRVAPKDKPTPDQQCAALLMKTLLESLVQLHFSTDVNCNTNILLRFGRVCISFYISLKHGRTQRWVTITDTIEMPNYIKLVVPFKQQRLLDTLNRLHLDWIDLSDNVDERGKMECVAQDAFWRCVVGDSLQCAEVRSEVPLDVCCR